ncbi:MAG: P1 family peptidase [candidate division WOR-3 bacterium]|nr:P1 family peptidase [candidate division WOR-3 bacterium]
MLNKIGFKIGHYSNCSVIICPENTVGSYYSLGYAPGSRELELLKPDKTVNIVNAILLTGSSVFGLIRAEGVVKFLVENNVGYKTPFKTIPIVPSAVIYDFGVLDISPKLEDGYNACMSAGYDITIGKVGVGMGATVGKWAGFEYKDEGGLGFYGYEYKDLVVCCVSVVNSVGDIVGRDGRILKGAKKDNSFLAQSLKFRSIRLLDNTNTTLIVILTNAKLSKLECYKLSKRSVYGVCRAIEPAFTSYDGDIIFTLSKGEVDFDFEDLCEITNFVVSESIRSVAQNKFS